MASDMKLITLISSDGHPLDVPEAAALMSDTVKNIVEDDCADGGIPLPNVDSKTLSKVIEFCEAHAATPAATAEALNKFDADYMEPIKNDQQFMFNLVLAANYMNIKKLLDVTCQTIADVVKDMSPEEVRKYFNIVNDFSPEEEEKVRKENAWAFELNDEKASPGNQ